MKHDWNSMSTAERDALVLAHVMSWHLEDEMWHDKHGEFMAYSDPDDAESFNCDFCHGGTLFSPSTQIADAMEVLGEARKEKPAATILINHEGYIGVYMDESLWMGAIDPNKDSAVCATGFKIDELPEAICLASLRAKGVDV